MPKEWEELDSWDAGKLLQPGDTVGIVGHHNEIVTVVKVSPSGQVTTTSTQTKYDGRTGKHEPVGRRYFTARGQEKGSGGSFYRAPSLAGTKKVRKYQRAQRYAEAIGALSKFVEKLDKLRGDSGFGSHRTNGEPITLDEYREIARLAKACLDDGAGDERPRVYCLDCWADTSRKDYAHAKHCPRYVPPPEEPPPYPDGTCPGCGMRDPEYCTESCETQSHPRPYTEPQPTAAAEGDE